MRLKIHVISAFWILITAILACVHPLAPFALPMKWGP
jgi:hypothetical protein